MNRFIRYSILALSLASVIAASPATRAGMWNEQPYPFTLASYDSSDFFFGNSSFYRSVSGPAWFMNAMPGSHLSPAHFLSSYDRNGDRIESPYAYANDIGTLANPFNVMLFNNVALFPSSGATSKNSAPVIAAVSTTFYWNGSGAITSVTSWGTNTDGSGTNPANFTSANQVFEFQNGQSGTLTANWTVSGAGSSILIDNGATLDAAANTVANGSGATFNMAAGATFKTAASYSALSFGTIDSTSLFIYSGSSASFAASKTYGGLQYQSSTAVSTPGDINTTGLFTLALNTAQIVNNTATSHTWNIGTDVTINNATTLVLAQNSAASTGTSILNIGGGLTNNGTISKGALSTGPATINFNGTGTSSVTWGTNSGSFDVNIGSASSTKTINMTDSLNNGTGVVGVFGTLNLGSAAKLNGTGRVTVNRGGTLNLGANNQFNSTTPAPMTLGSATGTGTATLNAGGFSQGTNNTAGIGALTLASNATIDLTNNSLLHFAPSTTAATGVLSILDWTGLTTTNATTGGTSTDLLRFGTQNTDLSYISSIQFVDPVVNGVLFSGTYAAMFATLNPGEVVPDTLTLIPEPSTWIGAGLALAAIGFTQRKKLRGLIASRA